MDVACIHRYIRVSSLEMIGLNSFSYFNLIERIRICNVLYFT